jgi:hypothetical protein
MRMCSSCGDSPTRDRRIDEDDEGRLDTISIPASQYGNRSRTTFYRFATKSVGQT